MKDLKKQHQKINPSFPIAETAVAPEARDRIKKSLIDIPPDIRMAYLVQHSDPDYESNLTKISNLKVATHTPPDIGEKMVTLPAQPFNDYKPSGIILLTIQDITDLMNTNCLLVQKNEQLQKYNEQLETFNLAASHDLQDPLRQINMFCNKIIEKEKGLSNSGSHDLGRIKFVLNNMNQLITDLISYSRTTFVENEYKSTDMNVLLRKTIRDLKENISEKKAVIRVSQLPVLDVIPFQIQQLFTNLITNAIKYTNEGTIPQISIENEEPSADEIAAIEGDRDIKYVKIKVSDNGIGFNQEYENKIFEPFYRLHSKKAYKGSGLGLSLVKKIIVNHKGFIKVVSKVNYGSQFFIYFPVHN